MLLSASVLGHRFHPDALAAISLLGGDRGARAYRRARPSRVPHHRRRAALAGPRPALVRPGGGPRRRLQHGLACGTAGGSTWPPPTTSKRSTTRSWWRRSRSTCSRPCAPLRSTPTRRSSRVARSSLSGRRPRGRWLSGCPPRRSHQLQDALDLVDDEATRAGLWQDAAVAARAVPRFDLAETFLRQLIDWQGATGQPREAARSRAQLASLLLATERHGSALTDLEAALGGRRGPVVGPVERRADRPAGSGARSRRRRPAGAGRCRPYPRRGAEDRSRGCRDRRADHPRHRPDAPRQRGAPGWRTFTPRSPTPSGRGSSGQSSGLATTLPGSSHRTIRTRR